jgi:uncharacterized membrane protein YukC
VGILKKRGLFASYLLMILSTSYTSFNYGSCITYLNKQFKKIIEELEKINPEAIWPPEFYILAQQMRNGSSLVPYNQVIPFKTIMLPILPKNGNRVA